MRGWVAGGAAGQANLGQTIDPSQPGVAVAAVAVAAVLVVVGALWLVRRWRTSTGEQFQSVVGDVEAVAVMLHPNPDPDAMAAALAAAAIAERAGTPATIQYPGQIRHQENRAFQTVLDVDFERVSEFAQLAAEDVVLVDHNEPRGFAGASDLKPLAVVDHHPGDGTGRAFTDVRSEYGACSTILTEYVRSLGWTPADPGDDDPAPDELSSAIATGLLYGILTDTDRLTRGTVSADFEAAEFLQPAVDNDRLDRIANPQVDADVLDIKARAIRNIEIRSPFAISDVGTVDNVDAIPQAADELERLEGVTAIVVVGDREGTLHLSGRSRDDRVHMGKALETVVEDIPMADAGGHARMGGGQISEDHMDGLGPGDGVDRTDLHDRLFDAMNGDV